MVTEHEIKKYANRRLYDSTASRHVTLEDIRKLIASGKKVKVIEDKTGADITRSVLLQVISEQEHFGTPVLSTELLESIIRFSGNPVQLMITKFMEQSVGAIAQQQREFQAQMEKAMPGPLAPFTEMTRKNMEQWSALQSSLMSGFAPKTPGPKTAGQKSQSSDEDGNG